MIPVYKKMSMTLFVFGCLMRKNSINDTTVMIIPINKPLDIGAENKKKKIKINRVAKKILIMKSFINHAPLILKSHTKYSYFSAFLKG